MQMRASLDRWTHPVAVRGKFVVACRIASAMLIIGVQAVMAAPSTSSDNPSVAPKETQPHPLPLAGSWNCGFVEPQTSGFAPANQIKLIDDGHHLILTFTHPSFPEAVNPPVDNRLSGAGFNDYYEAAIKRAAALKLPIVFIASQWESLLHRYHDLPAQQNPYVIHPDGTIGNEVSPFGPTEPWREVGRFWTDNDNLKKLQQWYPDPPLVIFLSNNENNNLRWVDVETSDRYLKKYGKDRDDDFRRKVVGDGWIERFRLLQAGMREGLTNSSWKQNARFFGYGGDAGMEAMGRWGGWRHYSLETRDRIGPQPLMWDGGSASYYTHNWNPSTDFRVWSPQIEFQNVVFQNKLARQLNPDLWYELSMWDGNEPKLANDKRKYYASLGQTFTPERYGAMVQFGMWLLRPQSVREFRGYTESWEEQKPYFMAIVDVVDHVHDNATLRKWWQYGKLVPNRAHEHHYQTDFPEQYKNEDRWFLLDADVNFQEYPWELFWEVRVFSIALVRGEAPKREWLVYAHSPLADRKEVQLTIPEYGKVTVDVPIAGAFHEVHENDRSVTLIQP
ncbi:MAG: hypothetical protein IT440_09245 [Phycisphaeraceae bacterium]|nr:hypothetical protein [Phycisphaeraceae bacterium]